MFFTNKKRIKKVFLRNHKVAFVACLLFTFLFVNSTSAFVAGSSNYRIQSDSVSIGGDSSSSASYGVSDTVGESATGESSSASYKMKAGYQQMLESSISVSSPSDVSLTAIGLSQSTSTGSVIWTVITDNTAGYTATIDATSTASCPDRASDGQEDIMCDISTGEAFQDLATTTRDTWASMTSASDNYYFGFSSVAADGGSHVDGWGTDADNNCTTTDDVPSTTLSWQGFWAGNEIQIASSTSRTDTDGEQTAMCLAVEQAGTVLAPSGAYNATTTITVLAL